MIQCAKKLENGQSAFFHSNNGEKCQVLLLVEHYTFTFVNNWYLSLSPKTRSSDFSKIQMSQCCSGKNVDQSVLLKTLNRQLATITYNFKVFISCRCIFFCHMYVDVLDSIFSFSSERSHMSMTILKICVVADSVCLLYCNLIRYQHFSFMKQL